MPEQDKGKFSANIGDDVIKEALRSVEKHTTKPGAAGPPAPGAASSGDAPGDGTDLDLEAPAGSEAEPQSPEAKELASLRAQLEFSQAKSRELMDKFKEEHERTLRATADLDNYRKRAVKEKDEVQRFGIEKLLKDFLPVVDNFDRALEHAKSASDFESLVKGIKMTRKLFEDALGKHGVKGFTSVGKPFDPRMHEAMQQVETSDMPPNHVYGEVLRGFTLNDRLVRPALVMVTKPKSGAADPQQSVQSVQSVQKAQTGGDGEGGAS